MYFYRVNILIVAKLLSFFAPFSVVTQFELDGFFLSPETSIECQICPAHKLAAHRIGVRVPLGNVSLNRQKEKLIRRC